uniref:Uncharacterized protein n=1 Tax=Cannabis sativa TaxID=3483 RepID=A0A803NMC1_CANSA
MVDDSNTHLGCGFWHLEVLLSSSGLSSAMVQAPTNSLYGCGTRVFKSSYRQQCCGSCVFPSSLLLNAGGGGGYC